MPVGITNEMNVGYLKTSFSRNSKGLYVTAIGVEDNKDFNDTMSFIHDNFRLRDHTQKEMWLVGLEIPNGMRSDERYSMDAINVIYNF